MIQLRIRSEFSFGRAYAPLKKTVAHLKSIGCTAAGVVDFASTWAHVNWFLACKEAGIQPLLGIELPVGEEQQSMWFLAKNEAGLRELYRTASRAHKQPITTKWGSVARLYPTDVMQMSDDIVKFAGDILDEDLLKRCNAVIDLSPASRVLNFSKQQIAQRCGLRVVNVSDNAYCSLADRQTFEILTDRGMKPSPQHILPDLQVTDDALAIANACKDLQMPKAPMIRAKGDLEQLSREGIKARGWTKKTWPKEYEARMQHELKTIREKDFESYFIVVADMVRYAKEHMLVGPSRGSAAGSLVCYLTRITEIDPVPPGLFFERFIDISRSDLPDIDLDFPDNKRHMVFTYMAEKYGADNVCHIGTISTFKPKSALIHVCKKLRIPPQATAAVKIAMIERSSADARANNCLLDTLKETTPGKELVRLYPQVLMSADLEAHASHTGIHAAGLLVCNERIDEFATITADGIAQVEMKAAEKIGLLKVDVLGLRTLGVLEDSGVKVDWYGLKFDDPETFDIFNKKRFCSIFQFEGRAMRDVSHRMTFSSLSDIDAVTALARPGPFQGGVTEEFLLRREGKQYQQFHPLVEKSMKETFGLPIYQEQTMAIVREIGQFDWKDTSAIRRGISKRLGVEYFDTLWAKFLMGALKNGMSGEDAKKVWSMINAMGGWQMNKAHTYSYAVLSYWTAWLKAHHPLEFAAANLRNAKDEETATQLLRELAAEGIIHTRFDPLLSEETWSIKDGKLIAGYDSLKGFGESKAKKYVEARAAGNLTQDMIAKALKAEDVFADIFPIQTKYGDMYANPQEHGVLGNVHKIAELTGENEGSYVFIGNLIRKNPRHANNEEILVRKRGGKMLKGPLDFLDITVQDDTGLISGRIDRYKYQQMGKELFEKIPLGAVILVRARFKKGIRFGFIQKWKAI